MASSERPNILFFLTDHFRRDAIGKWTPNLFNLCRQGVRFSHAYCGSPLCMPSRTSLVTGLLPSQNGVCGNMATPISEALREDTYPNHLRRAGYRTSLVGKHHWIDSYGLGVDVTELDATVREYGFDDVFQVADELEAVHNDDELTHHLRAEGRLDKYRDEARRKANAREPFEMPEDDYADRFIANAGKRWLEESAPKEQPWYLNVSFVGPHPPFWHPGGNDFAPEETPFPLTRSENPDQVRAKRADYLQKCILIDRYIGEILETLEARGERDNTLIVFASDHGDMLGDFDIWDKRHFYEQSVGVPLIMAGPGIPLGDRELGGQVRHDLVSLLDLYPTFLATAGVDPETAPSFRGRRFGVDLHGVLEEGRQSGHSLIYSELGTSVMAVTGPWKIVYDPEQGGVTHLFNHRRDPRELDNLAGVAGYEGVTAELLADLLGTRIGLSQYNHEKERTRLQRTRRTNTNY